jgi:UDP-N-acetylglucosamine acyltransferase
MTLIIAQTAIVDPRAELGDDVRIGHFCVIGPHVRIGAGTRLENHVTITGHTTIGRDNHFHPGCVIGGEPQDLGYRGSPTCVVIGDNNVFREHVTVHRGSEKEDGITSVGDRGYFMTNAHIAHDCRVGNRVVIANNSMLGGHVHVHDDAVISGGVGVHHFTSIGQFSFVAGLGRVITDVPPFMLCEGQPARPRTINMVALKRNNFSRVDIQLLNAAFRLLYREKVGVDKARAQLSATDGGLAPVLATLFEFLDQQGDGRHGRGRDRRKAA